MRHSFSLRWQLQAPGDPGPGPVACFPAFRWQTDRLPAVQQPEEPGQVQGPRPGLLPEELRRRFVLCSLKRAPLTRL